MNDLLITKNHEVWRKCPICNHEFDLRLYGYNCPNCKTTVK